MRFLFIKTELGWPRTSGHDVHAFHMMQALGNAGHDVALLTAVDPTVEATTGLTLIDKRLFPTDGPTREDEPVTPTSDIGWRGRWSWRQERFRSYWGIDASGVRFARDHAEALEVDAVVAVGLEVLPYLTEIRHSQRIWYAADEWVWHHLSLFRPLHPQTWSHVRQSCILGLYEHSFSNIVDRAWVVSPTDQRAMRLVMRSTAVDLIPNGVDTAAFSPTDDPVEARSCTFWGNLGFAPNEQALVWFCREVWPLVRRANPDAQFNIFGFGPSPVILQLAVPESVVITSNVPEIRVAVGGQAVVVLPFLSGGGIKNKLLEAASLAKPIVCTPRACNGLNATNELPFRIVPTRARSWADAIAELWANPDTSRELGTDAREWVTTRYSWQTAAELAVASVTRPK